MRRYDYIKQTYVKRVTLEMAVNYFYPKSVNIIAYHQLVLLHDIFEVSAGNYMDYSMLRTSTRACNHLATITMPGTCLMTDAVRTADS